MDAAKVKHDAKLTAWAEDHGKKRNVRTLLSTMHTVSQQCRRADSKKGFSLALFSSLSRRWVKIMRSVFHWISTWGAVSSISVLNSNITTATAVSPAEDIAIGLNQWCTNKAC